MLTIKKIGYVRGLLMIVSAVGMVVFGFLFCRESLECREGGKAYEELRPQAVENVNGKGQEQTPAFTVDYQGLMDINGDFSGWIRGEGIDYPVVLASDNEFYLTHLFDGRKNKFGTIFIDSRNSRDFSDKNTLVYGHNIKGQMFAPLTYYKKQTHFDLYPEMFLYTPNGDYRIVLVAGVVVDGSKETQKTEFVNESDFLRYVDELRNRSTFTSPVNIESGERIISLLTCSYEFTDARYMVVGKLVPLFREQAPTP